jgi:hypothetical protein
MRRKKSKTQRPTSSKGKMSLKKIVIIAVIVVLGLIALDKMSAPKTHTRSLDGRLDNVPVESSINLEGYSQ